MDKEREIRFLYPPLIVGAFFVWWWLADSAGWRQLSAIAAVLRNLGELPGAVTALIAGGSAILVAGFVLGTLTYLVLRSVALFMGFRTHEIPCDETALREIWATSGTGKSFSSEDDVQMATVWLDFANCGEVHGWIVRRWNAFNTSINCALGLLLVLLNDALGHPDHPHPSGWFLVGAIGFLGFLSNGLIAHNETMRMLRFAAKKIAIEASHMVPKNGDKK